MPTVRSIVGGLAWPGLPDDFGKQMLGLQYQFAQTERWPAALMRRQQMRQLAALLAHAWDHVPFYRPRLEAAGYRPGAEPDEAQWRRMPVLTRRELQANGAALRAAKVPERHGAIGTTRTSGSTGVPVEVAATHFNALLWEAVTLRDSLWHRRDLGDTLAALRAPHHVKPGRAGLVGRMWNVGIASAFANGRSVMNSSMLPAAEQLDWLMRQNAYYLLCPPSVLRELCAESVRRGANFPRLKAVLTVGETVPPNLRGLVRSAWNLPVQDNYSAMEIGYLALQCPDGDAYHVQAETMLVEVLDEFGAPCPAGQIGRVVVTPLHNFAMPLLRYEIGDHAERGDRCPCGRTLPILARIVGRTRNMLTHADGRRTWPFMGRISGHASAAIVRFQVAQRRIDRLEVLLVVARPLSRAEEDEIRALVLQACGPDFAVDLSYRDAIPPAAGGKFEDFVSDVTVPA